MTVAGGRVAVAGIAVLVAVAGTAVAGGRVAVTGGVVAVAIGVAGTLGELAPPSSVQMAMSRATQRSPHHPPWPRNCTRVVPVGSGMK